MVVEVTSEPRPRRLQRLKRASSSVRRSALRARERAFFQRILLTISIVLALSTALAIFHLYTSYSAIVDERLASGYLTSRAGIYAAPRVLRAGQHFSRERLVEALRRAGYVDVEASEVWNGRFTVDDRSVVIHPRRSALVTDDDSPIEGMKVEEVKVSFNAKNRIEEITADGLTLESYMLEPEAITNDTSMKTGTRGALAYADIPPVLARAVLSIEDRRFFEHRGVDGLGIVRAAWSWVGAGKEGERNDTRQGQGGSTITQQLVKNTYLSPERTLRRKLNEAMLAGVLERRLSKEDIFALYCNEIYLGQRNGVAVRGVGQAARIYFGKELNALSLAEAATIAGMIQSPARYSPDRHPERARLRRDTVINAMLRDGAITVEQAEAAKAEPLAVVPVAVTSDATAPYFIDYVNRLTERAHDDASAAGDEDGRHLAVHTTIDLELQQLAERAVRRQLDQLEKIYQGKRRPQAALVALDPNTGHVLAMVGGNRYVESQLNRATDARRQPGSVFKPFVYAAAIESGVSPVSMYTDAPRTFQFDRRATYRPANYGGGYSMRDVTLRTGLIRSLNVVTVDVAMRTGLARVAGLAESFGLPKPAAYPSLALGTTEATPLEVATAYAALANGGRRIAPTAIARSSGDGAYIPADPATGQQLVRPSTAYVITDMLAAVMDHGTARAARGAFKGTAVAGKTGTSRDGWFAGYTPNLVCVVWIGFDDGEQLGLTGAESALPAWTEFVRGAVELRPELGGANFTRPSGVISVEIDSETGLLASDSCRMRERIAVTAGHAPNYECSNHAAPYTLLASAAGEEQNDPTAVAGIAQMNDGGRAASLVDSSSNARRLASTALRASAPADTENIPRQSTGVEVSKSGRSKLTSEMRVSASAEGLNR